MSIEFSARTDVGRVRDHNEDNFLIDRKLHLYVVCDGMGGHASGEVASATAVNAIREALVAAQPVLDAYRHRGNVFEADVLQILEAAVQGANRRVYDSGLRNAAHRGMGTTLSALLLLGDRGFVGHVGDSRVYRRREGRTLQLTEDHSFYEEIRRRQPAIAHTLGATRLKNAITRAIGASERLEVDTFDFEVQPDDRFMLCSDGLHGYFDNTETPNRFMALDDLDTAAEGLIAYANGEGGEDNVTCILVRVGDTLETTAQPPAFHQLRPMPLFRHLTDEELGVLLGVGDLRTYAAADLVFAEGSPTDHLYILLSGTVVISSGETLISRVGPGQYIGSITIMDGGRRNATARASGLSPVTALAVKREAFNDILRDEPVLGCKLLWSIARSLAGRLRTATERLVAHAAESGAATAEGGEHAAERRAPTMPRGASAAGAKGKGSQSRAAATRPRTAVFQADADEETLDNPQRDLSHPAPDTADFQRPEVAPPERSRRRTHSDTVPRNPASPEGAEEPEKEAHAESSADGT